MGRATDPDLSYRVWGPDEIPVSSLRRTEPPSPWPPFERASKELLSAARGWASAPTPRPPWRAQLQLPAEELARTARPVLALVDWKKTGLGFALGLGVTLALCFSVFLAMDTPRRARPPANVSASMPSYEPTPATQPEEVFIP